MQYESKSDVDDYELPIERVYNGYNEHGPYPNGSHRGTVVRHGSVVEYEDGRYSDGDSVESENKEMDQESILSVGLANFSKVIAKRETESYYRLPIPDDEREHDAKDHSHHSSSMPTMPSSNTRLTTPIPSASITVPVNLSRQSSFNERSTTMTTDFSANTNRMLFHELTRFMGNGANNMYTNTHYMTYYNLPPMRVSPRDLGKEKPNSHQRVQSLKDIELHRLSLQRVEDSRQKHESELLEILKYDDDAYMDTVTNAICNARPDVLCHFLPLIAFVLCQSDKNEWRRNLMKHMRSRLVGPRQADLRQSVRYFVKSYTNKAVQQVFAGLIDDVDEYSPKKGLSPSVAKNGGLADNVDCIQFWIKISKMTHQDDEKIKVPYDLQLMDPVNQLGPPLRYVKIKKVINSNSKPLLVETYGRDESDRIFLSSTFILKQGDDLRKDKSCMLVFKWINHMFITSNSRNLKYGDALVKILTYNVIPMTNTFGCIQLIPNCVPLQHILTLKTYIASNPGLMTNLVTTAAGSYIASYIMGIRDRHFDNILIRETDCVLFHIDMNYVMGEKVTGLDANKFGITKEFYDILGKVNYEVFIDLACHAFLQLRSNHEELINFACLAFSYVVDYKVIRHHMHRRLKLQFTDEQAREWLTKKLTDAPFSSQTAVKNVIHKLATSNLKSAVKAKMSTSPPQ